MISTRTFFSVCLLLKVVLQVDCASEDEALSIKVSRNLVEIFENVADVNWRALWTLYDTVSDYLGFGFNVASKVTKTVGATVDYTSRGVGRTGKWTGRSLNHIGSGLQKGIVYISKCMNRITNIFHNYGQKLTRGGKNTSGRRRR